MEKEKITSMANGSSTELQNQLLIAKDVGYITQEGFQDLAGRTVSVRKLLNALISKIRSSL